MAKIVEDKKQDKTQDCDICFIITPIGDDGSITRKKADGLINNVIKPVCDKLNLKAIPAHEIDKPGSITNQVIQMIMDSKMVIANLTGLNPNVMYELAIRHAAKLPVVCLAEEGTKLPFDITTERTIFYSDDMFGAVSLKPILEKKLLSAIEDIDIDNPIYRAIKEKLIIKEITSSDNKENSDSLLYILQRLENIENSLKFQNSEVIVRDPDSKEYVTKIILSDKIDISKKELLNIVTDKIPYFIQVNYDPKIGDILIRSNYRIPLKYLQDLEEILNIKYNIRFKDVIFVPN